jgi:hypothetical protein
VPALVGRERARSWATASRKATARPSPGTKARCLTCVRARLVNHHKPTLVVEPGQSYGEWTVTGPATREPSSNEPNLWGS